MQPTNDPCDISKFSKLEGMEVKTATSSDDFVANVKANVKLNHKKFHELIGFQVVKGHNNPIGLIGGGPSIKAELDNIREFQRNGFPIIACGSAHDYIVSQGIIPDYCTLCDPDPIMAEYIKRHNENTKYLVALSCHPCVFELLKDRQIYVWNCRSDEAAERLKEELVGHVDILGGCTVGLRSIPIAMCLGYTNHHFWGFDSCMGSGSEHHAYEFETDKEEVGVTYPVRFGDTKPEENGKYYICSGYQLAQAYHFQQFLLSFGQAFTPTFHGEGMLKDFVDFLRQKSMENIIGKIQTNVDHSNMVQAA